MCGEVWYSVANQGKGGVWLTRLTQQALPLLPSHHTLHTRASRGGLTLCRGAWPPLSATWGQCGRGCGRRGHIAPCYYCAYDSVLARVGTDYSCVLPLHHMCHD